VNTIFWKRVNRIAANWHKWCAGQGDETVNFWGQEIKGQRCSTSKLHLETWLRYHSRLIRPNRFSDFEINCYLFVCSKCCWETLEFRHIEDV